MKTLNEELRQKTERVKEVALAVAEKYPDIARNPTNPLNVQGIQSKLDKLNARFSNLEEQLSDKVVIAFVGATNSGKSSLINALLRDDRLPVCHGETTMCAIKVCTTKAAEWKFYLHGNELPQNTIEEVKELLSRMSGQENEDARTQLQLETRSVVQIDWPKHLCKWLPENVVLYDTPGFNVDRDAMNLIEEWCRKADIIVAVMDVSSPALVELARLVARVECQYTFGVYTKWDRFLQEIQRSRTRVDHNQYKSNYTKNYLEMVDRELETMNEETHRQEVPNETQNRTRQARGREHGNRYEKVFFVDIGSMEENQLPFADYQGEPTEDNTLEETYTEGQRSFLKFERALGETARDLKGPILIRVADNVFQRAGKVFEQFQNLLEYIREKRNEPLDRLDAMKKDLASLQELKESIKSTKELLHGILNDDAINELEEELCERLENCKSEKETLNQMLEKVNDQMKASIEREDEEVNKKYKQWRENRKSDHEFSLSEALPNYGVHQCHPFTLLRGVGPVLMGVACGIAVGAAIGTAGAALVPAAVAVGALEIGLVAGAGGGAGLFGTIGGLVAYRMKSFERERQKRREVAKQSLRNKLKKYREVDRNSPPLEEIERISSNISCEIESLREQYESSEEIQDLRVEITQLVKRIEEISGITTHLQVMRGKLNELGREMNCTTVEVSPDDQTEDQTEHQTEDQTEDQSPMSMTEIGAGFSIQ